EPSAPFRAMGARQVDVDDHVTAFVAGAAHRQAQLVANEALAAVAGHHPIGVRAVLPERIGDLEFGTIFRDLETIAICVAQRMSINPAARSLTRATASTRNCSM